MLENIRAYWNGFFFALTLYTYVSHLLLSAATQRRQMKIEIKYLNLHKRFPKLFGFIFPRVFHLRWITENVEFVRKVVDTPNQNLHHSKCKIFSILSNCYISSSMYIYFIYAYLLLELLLITARRRTILLTF